MKQTYAKYLMVAALAGGFLLLPAGPHARLRLSTK